MNKDFTASYYIGCNDKDKHKQLMLTSTILDKINRILQAYNITSFTIKECTGIYKKELEHTIEIMLLNNTLDKVIIDSLKQELNQECIMEVITDCNVKFI